MTFMEHVSQCMACGKNFMKYYYLECLKTLHKEIEFLPIYHGYWDLDLPDPELSLSWMVTFPGSYHKEETEIGFKPMSFRPRSVCC